MDHNDDTTIVFEHDEVKSVPLSFSCPWCGWTYQNAYAAKDFQDRVAAVEIAKIRHSTHSPYCNKQIVVSSTETLRIDD